MNLCCKFRFHFIATNIFFTMCNGSFDLLGNYRCLSLENTVDYCEKLGVSKFLLRLVPLAPLPRMRLVYNREREEFTFTGTFKVGPFSFDDNHVFKTDGSISRIKLTPSLFGAATVVQLENSLVITVRSILDDPRAKTLPKYQHIVINRTLDGNQKKMIDEHHELFETIGEETFSVSWQRVIWEKLDD